MEYARVSRLDAPPGGLAAGIDWASADHAVCVVDAAGTVADRFSVAHTAAGLRALVQRLARAGVREAAIGRDDGPVVDALMAAGMTVVVITDSVVQCHTTEVPNHAAMLHDAPSLSLTAQAAIGLEC